MRVCPFCVRQLIECEPSRNLRVILNMIGRLVLNESFFGESAGLPPRSASLELLPSVRKLLPSVH